MNERTSRLWRVGVAAALAAMTGVVAAADGPLRIQQTQIRTVLRDRVDGVLQRVAYESSGPVLDERHRRRVSDDKPDGKVHIALTDQGDGQYLLTLQSLDTGTADHFRAAVAVVFPSRVSCYMGYWEIVDFQEVRNDLADVPTVYATAWDSTVQVVLGKRVDGPIRFLGGQYQASFWVREHCF
jgi:hypothetical protein